jgi:seryl-tRNA synthetase
MNCHELAQRIERLQPQAETRDVARLCLLLANTTDDVTKLGDERQLTTAWREAGLKLQLATDQHAAMTEELESLARSDPKKFTPDQIWVLIRAIKVQSQILQLYVGQPVLDA